MRRRIGMLSCIVIVIISAALPVRADDQFADPAFKAVWARTDAAVATGKPNRSWLWGPQPMTAGLVEEYTQAPQGRRLVQYFDKARMEINNPAENRNDLWYVTNGLLPVELITGRMQVGDNQFVERAPATLSAIGDPDNTFPTYADLRKVFTREGAGDRIGNPVTGLLFPDGTIGEESTMRDDPATHVALIEHNHGIPRAFLTFMNQQSEPFGRAFVFGAPVSGAYWVWTMVNRSMRPVMFQVYERRILTYTSLNPEPFLVEAGNVGRHYHQWRYGR